MGYKVTDYDKCDFCNQLYKHVTFMNIRACDEHEEKAEKRSDDIADMKAEMSHCND